MESKIRAIENWLSKIVLTVAAVEIMIATLIVFAITIGRYFFGVSWEWAEEFLRYLVVCAALLASGPMVFNESHIVMDILANRLKSPKIKYYHRLYTVICIGICAVLLFVWGLNLTMNTKMRSYSLIFPMAMAYAIIPLSMGVMSIYSFLKIALTIVTRPQTGKGVKL